MPNDLIQSPEQARAKLRSLSHDILRLKEDIPKIADLASRVEGNLNTIEDTLKETMQLAEELANLCVNWSQDLAGRYTFLLNLRQWLLINGNDHGKGAPDHDQPTSRPHS